MAFMRPRAQPPSTIGPGLKNLRLSSLNHNSLPLYPLYPLYYSFLAGRKKMSRKKDSYPSHQTTYTSLSIGPGKFISQAVLLSKDSTERGRFALSTGAAPGAIFLPLHLVALRCGLARIIAGYKLLLPSAFDRHSMAL